MTAQAHACRRAARFVAACALLTLSAPALSHEIEANRLTIVQRGPQHFALTFYVDYVELLRSTLAPSASTQEFASVCAAVPDERLGSQLRAAHAAFERALDVRTVSGERLRVGPLRWPAFRDAQRRLREAAMRGVVDPTAHEHAAPVEITGDAVAAVPVDELRVTLPRTLGTVVVVSYRPTQQEVAADRGRPFAVRY
jgi:hypothetical protein